MVALAPMLPPTPSPYAVTPCRPIPTFSTRRRSSRCSVAGGGRPTRHGSLSPGRRARRFPRQGQPRPDPRIRLTAFRRTARERSSSDEEAAAAAFPMARLIWPSISSKAVTPSRTCRGRRPLKPGIGGRLDDRHRQSRRALAERGVKTPTPAIVLFRERAAEQGETRAYPAAGDPARRGQGCRQGRAASGRDCCCAPSRSAARRRSSR